MTGRSRRHNYPQVLLLGNGINRAYGGGSWGQLIREISRNRNLPPESKLHLPMPLRAILVTEDTVDERLREVSEVLYGALGDEGHTEMLRELLALGFDHILTTNFSYELEMAAGTMPVIPERADHTGDESGVERKYLLYTYEDLPWKGHNTRVWHIHGEGSVPESMILGHYYYANLLERIMAYLRREGDRYLWEQEHGMDVTVKSWADAFLMGDVYMLGFGCDVSEFDLWWLLNRKKKETARTGETHFFAPAELNADGINEKEELLKVLGVQVHHCGMERPDGDAIARSLGFRRFYQQAIAEIRNLMEQD